MTRNKSSKARVEFRKHPPERRRGIGTQGDCCCGCCCCCCCLHSLGGLVGAAVGSRPKGGSWGGRGVRSYWALLAAFTVLTVSLPTLAHWRQFVGGAGGVLNPAGSFPLVLAENLKTGMFVALLSMPLIQLLCSAIMAIWVEVRQGDGVQEKSASRRTIGKITLRMFLGALAGLVIMFILFQMMKGN
jgi:hypothetical protein